MFFAFFVTLLMVPSLYGIGLDISVFFTPTPILIKLVLLPRDNYCI